MPASAKPPARAGVAAIILAAGEGRRWTSGNKLLACWHGRPLVAIAADSALNAPAAPVIVVLGHEAPRIADALATRPVTCVVNPDYASGMASSIRVGLAALPAPVDAAVLLLADMPAIGAGHVARLIAAFCDEGERHDIFVPVFHGRRGNPVLWSARLFPALATLTGDRGGRALFERYADRIAPVEMADDAVLIDLDSDEAWARARLLR